MVLRLFLVLTFMLSGASLASAQSGKVWFVILQSLQGGAEMEADAARLNWNKRCKIGSQTASTDIIAGLKPGLQIVFVGPFKSRNAALNARAGLKKCAPDAYMKQASWTGE